MHGASAWCYWPVLLVCHEVIGCSSRLWEVRVAEITVPNTSGCIEKMVFVCCFWCIIGRMIGCIPHPRQQCVLFVLAWMPV